MDARDASGSDATLDLVALGEPLIELNQTRSGDGAYRQDFGGDTSNCAIAAARLGLRAAYISRVGDDAFGRLFLDLWRREGVDTRGVAVDAQAFTGLYFVTHSAAGHAFAYLRAGSAASRLRPEDLPVEMLDRCRALHVSGIGQAIGAGACDATFAAIERARRAGARIAYDPNLRLKLWPLARARAVIRETIALCDWFLPSVDEIAVLGGREGADAALDWCHAQGAPLVALKCGADGACVSDGRRRVRVPGHVVECVDATGAGDCFDGAFIARILAGDAPATAARYANAAAALKTRGYGAVAPLPRSAEVEALLRRSA